MPASFRKGSRPLAPAARAVGGPAIRNMATIGGNLVAPHPYGDLTVALLALDGEVQMADGSTQPLEQYLASRQGLVRAVSMRDEHQLIMHLQPEAVLAA